MRKVLFYIIMQIAVINYNMGNLGSAAKALTRLGAEVRVIERPDELARFRAALLPGVGSFGDGMENLRSAGMDLAIRDHLARGGWLLGICLGMQMMLDASEESPGAAGLGLMRGCCRRFAGEAGRKVPQIGWNRVDFVGGTPLADGLERGEFFYFVHSFHVPAGMPQEIGSTRYGIPFASAIAVSPRCFGVQFHPEKSQGAGLRLLENYLRLAAADGV